MKFKELKKSLAEKAEAIYLVSGEDAFFVEHSFKLICDAYLKEPSINLTVFSGQDIKDNVAPLLSALYSYPFLGDKRIVAAKEFYPSASALKQMKGYFDDPMPSTIFVILNSAPSETLAKQPGVTLVDCAKGDFSLLSGWIVYEGKKSGVTFTQSAVNRLIDACSYDMTRISAETGKLVAFALDTKTVTEDDVMKLCPSGDDYKLYEVVDLISKKDKDRAFSVLYDMLSGSDAQRLYSSLYNHFRRLLYAAIGGASAQETAKALKVKDYAIKKAKEQSMKFSVKRLKEIVDKLAEYDAAFKSGTVLPGSALWNGILNVLI